MLRGCTKLACVRIWVETEGRDCSTQRLISTNTRTPLAIVLTAESSRQHTCECCQLRDGLRASAYTACTEHGILIFFISASRSIIIVVGFSIVIVVTPDIVAEECVDVFFIFAALFFILLTFSVLCMLFFFVLLITS